MKASFGFKSALRVGMVAVAGFVALGAVSQAQALSLSVTGNKYQSAPISFSNSQSTGVYNQSMGGIQVNDGSNTFWVYCIDPLTSYGTPNQYATSSLYSYLNGGAYDAQFAQTPYTNKAPYYDNQDKTNILNKLVALYSHAYNDATSTTSSTTKSAAFQYTVWELMGEAGYGSTTGGLRLGTGAVAGFKTQVDAYLTALNTNTWTNVNGANLSTANNFTYSVYTPTPTAGSQAFLRVVSSTTTDTGNNVPEPGTLGLAAAALAGLGYARRRKAAA
jgi:hypothetical protein